MKNNVLPALFSVFLPGAAMAQTSGRIGELQAITQLTRLNRNDFPYVIYDEQNTQLLVDSRGNTVTPSGRQVGVLKNHLG